MEKPKVLISRLELDKLQKSDKDPCVVCLSGVDKNSIFCDGCSNWVHQRWGGISGTLNLNFALRCKRCTGLARPVDGRPVTEVTVGKGETWDGVILLSPSELCILRVAVVNSLSSKEAVSHRVNSMTSCQPHPTHPITPVRVYNWCVRSAMLHASETRPNLIWSASPATIWWSNDLLMCSVATKVKSTRQVSRRGYSSTIWGRHSALVDSYGMAMWKAVLAGLKSPQTPLGIGPGRGRSNKTWSEVIRSNCLALGLTETHHKSLGGTLRHHGIWDTVMINQVTSDWTHPNNIESSPV